MSGMQYRLFGGLAVLHAGQAVDVGSPKQRAVLGLLVLAGGRVVSTDELIDALWGAQPPAAATTSLHTYISNLRRALEPGRKPRDAPTTLLTRAPGYLLVAERDDVDWFRAEDLLAEGRALLADGHPTDAITRFTRALELVDSPPSLDLDDGNVVAQIRGRWEALREEVCEELLGARLTAGEHRAALRDLEEAVKEHPYNEGLRARLVLALYRSGRQRDALQALADARRALADDVGVEPGPELRRLEAAVLDQSPELDLVAPARVSVPAPEPVELPAPALVPPGDAFVGRVAELETLLGLARRVRAGLGGTAAVLTGEPGIGKTRLLDELAERCEAEGMVIARARCPEDGTTPAFWPVGQHGEQLLASGAVPADDLLQLGQLMQRTREGDASAQRFAIHAASVSALEAATRPLLIVLDDAQWADTATLRLTAYVAGELRKLPVLLVVSVRGNEPDPPAALVDCLGEMARVEGSVRIVLQGLGLDAVRQWLARSPLRFPTASTAALVHDRTAGNPLFVRELVALMASDTGLARSAATSRVVPQAVHDVIRRRIGRLPPVTQQLLVTAAVIGRDVELDVLADVAGADVAEVLDGLDPAFAAGVLEIDDGLIGRVRFAHALFTETLAAELSPARRARLHAAVVGAIERLRAGYLDAHLTMLAYHAAAGAPMGTGEKAYEYAVAAARRATARVADEEAARLWERALAALEMLRPGDREARFEALVELGVARSRASDDPGARDALVTAAELAIEAGEEDALLRALLPLEQPGLWPITAYGLLDERLVAALERAVGPITDDLSAERIRLLGMWAANLTQVGAGQRPRMLGQEAVAAARRSGDPVLLATQLVRQWVTLGPMRYEERQAIAAEVERLDRDHGLPDSVRSTCYLMVGLAAFDNVDLVTAESAMLRSRQMAERADRPALITEVGWFESLIHLARGRPDQAGEVALAAYDLYRRTRRANAETLLSGILVGARADQGRVEELLGTLDLTSTGTFALAYRASLGHAAAEAGLTDLARSLVLAPAEVTDLPRDYIQRATLVASAYTWWHLGVHEEAAGALARALLPLAERLSFPGSSGPFLGPVSLALGRLAVLAGDHDEGVRWLSEAVATCDKAGMPTWLARALADLGRTMRSSSDPGERAEGEAVLQRALSVAQSSGCAPVLRQLAAG